MVIATVTYTTTTNNLKTIHNSCR